MRERRKKFFDKSCIAAEILLIISTFFWIQQLLKEGRGIINPSQADCLVFADAVEYKVYILIPLFLWMVSGQTRDAKRVQILIRRKSRRDIWNKMLRQICIRSVIFSGSLAAFAAAAGKAAGIPEMNWTEEYSMYWYKCGGTVLPDGKIQLYHVFLRFFVVEALMFFLIGTMFALSCFLISGQIAGWIVGIGTGYLIFAAGEQGQSILYRDLSVMWDIWTKKNSWEGIAAGILLAAVFWTVGYAGIRRKGFLNEK